MAQTAMVRLDETAAARVAGRVRAILAQRRLTGRWLAGAVGMPPSTFNRRLNGGHPFDINELASVAQALGVPLTDLIAEVAA